jgi:hypothetical protein
MAIYSTNFSEYTTGVNLSDWTDYWSAGNFTYQAAVNSGTYKVSTKWCNFNSSTAHGRRVLTWDDVGSVADVDILVKIKQNGLTNNGSRTYARVSGSAASENAYLVAVAGGLQKVTIGKYLAGVSSNLAQITAFTQHTTDEYWVRFRVNGTSVKAKIWAEDAVEPNDWLLETTDSDLSSGYCGIGNYDSTQDFYCDFFECVTGGGTATYPPSSFTYNNAFVNYPCKDNTSYANWGRVLGGQFIDTSRKLKGVGVYCIDHSADIRVAVYSGGTLSDPTGATLLKDFGKTSGAVVTDWVDIFTTDDISVPSATPIWFVVKGNNASGFGTKCSDVNATGNAGCYQIARGCGDVTATIGSDPDVAFAATFPSVTPSFTAYWYDWKIYLDGHPDLPNTARLSQLVAEILVEGTPKTRLSQLVAEVVEKSIVSHSGTVTITANGALTCTGSPFGGAVGISGEGDLTPLGLGGHLGDVGISGGGSIVFPEMHQGVVAITANGSLIITTGIGGRSGEVVASANGSISGSYWVDQPMEKKWMESKLAQGIVGVSLLKRRVRK